MRALFLGEGTLEGAARYLAAALTAARIPFDHCPDLSPVRKTLQRKKYDLFILSDYRYANFTPSARRWVMQEVEKGAGFLMIGGWASFTGLVGGYAGTEIEKLLPVTCLRGEDRVQKATGALLLPSPNTNPPVICGYHQAKPKLGTHTAMIFRDLLYKGGKLTLGKPKPALVLGTYGRGRTAAFLTDCAPHWAGGLVDWGNNRRRVRIGRCDVEVGNQYLRFFQRLFVKLTG